MNEWQMEISQYCSDYMVHACQDCVLLCANITFTVDLSACIIFWLIFCQEFHFCANVMQQLLLNDKKHFVYKIMNLWMICIQWKEVNTTIMIKNAVFYLICVLGITILNHPSTMVDYDVTFLNQELKFCWNEMIFHWPCVTGYKNGLHKN